MWNIYLLPLTTISHRPTFLGDKEADMPWWLCSDIRLPVRIPLKHEGHKCLHNTDRNIRESTIQWCLFKLTTNVPALLIHHWAIASAASWIFWSAAATVFSSGKSSEAFWIRSSMLCGSEAQTSFSGWSWFSSWVTCQPIVSDLALQ